MNRTHTLMLVAVTCLVSTVAHAESPQFCAPTPEIDPLLLLRQTSLDLRGVAPSYDELVRVRDAADPTTELEAVIAEMTLSEEYFAQVREHHRDLLWGSLEPSILTSPYPVQRRLAALPNGVYRVPSSRRAYRGLLDLECLDQEQTEFDADGRPTPIQVYNGPNCLGGPCRLEGWVRVAPYWAPDTEIRVCAYDAQTALVGVAGQACDAYHLNDARCGCGPDLAWCGTDGTAVSEAFRGSLAEEPLRIFERIVREHRPYFEAFTTTQSAANGVVAHYYRHMSGTTTVDTNGGVSHDTATIEIPEVPYALDEWLPMERSDVHSGVLTTMAYLVRFPSNRARANQFYSEFLCDPFVPSEDGLPPEEAEPNPNLRERNGCADCHQTLEPAAAHWARWRTGGTHGYLAADVFDLLAPREECLCGTGTEVTCSAFCSTYYTTHDNASAQETEWFLGLPQASQWLTDGDRASADLGPRGLVDDPDNAQRMAECTVRQLATRLLGRELTADDLGWQSEQTAAFEASGYDFTALVEGMVHDPRYRTVQ